MPSSAVRSLTAERSRQPVPGDRRQPLDHRDHGHRRPAQRHARIRQLRGPGAGTPGGQMRDCHAFRSAVADHHGQRSPPETKSQCDGKRPGEQHGHVDLRGEPHREQPPRVAVAVRERHRRDAVGSTAKSRVCGHSPGERPGVFRCRRGHTRHPTVGLLCRRRGLSSARCDHPHVRTVPAHAARRPGRCGGAQPQAADPGRIRPADRAGFVQLAAAGIARAATHRGDRAAGDGRHRRARRSSPRAAAARPRTRPPTAGPSTGDGVFRLKDRRDERRPARAHPRGTVHPDGARRVSPRTRTLPAAARSRSRPSTATRPAPARRASCAGRRVRHEGRVLLRRRRRRPAPRVPRRIGAPTRRSSPAWDIRHAIAVGSVRRDGRQRLEEVPRRDRHQARTPSVRCLASGYAADVEAVTTAVPGRRSLSDGLPQPAVFDAPATPRPSPRWSTGPTVRSGFIVTAADTEERLCSRSGCRRLGTARHRGPRRREVDDKRLGAALDPADYDLLDDADFAKYPFLKKGYIGPKALLANGVRYLVDPRVVTGTSWITGADEAGRHVVGLVAGRDFTPDGTIEAAEVRDGDP